MNIRCPQCQTVFRVNPERIPPQGVRARCARCGGTFTVYPPSKQAGQEAPAKPSRPEAPQPQRPASPQAPPEAPRATAPEPARPAPATATADRPARPPFGNRDPKARAERLARALVSDIVAYHPDRREKSLAEGNLRSEFRDEIMKSWEEYVAQVGAEMAKSTPYFRDALNAILAKGQKLF
jgi:predicted Zn finger-like uncharacterized protein